MKKSKKILLFFLFITSGFLYYFIFSFGSRQDSFIEEKTIVKKVIDGDTLELEDGRKVRMLGINTPEKRKFMSKESLNFTKFLENKTVTLYYNKKDKYNRILGYVIFEDENFNKKILEEGFAHLYYYEKDEFFKEMEKAEEIARKNKKGIWKESPNKNCLSLLKFEYREKTKRCNNEELLVLNNSCNKSIKVLIKDDSTKQLEDEIKPGIFSKNFSCTFNDEGDSIYIWDSEGIILFYRYS